MASNPSTNIQASEPTIYETIVGEMQASPPPMPKQAKEPKVPNFKSQAAPVERNPFLGIELKIVPPKDSTQEALNAWGRAGYLYNALGVDKRVREQEILQQTVESKVNAIVNDEFERRRAILRGTYEATGMTPAEIDERFAAMALRQAPEAVQRASSDSQVRDALIRYFTLRGGVVPAYLTAVPPDAPTVNNAMGTTPAIAEGIPVEDADNVELEAAPMKPEWDEEAAESMAQGTTDPSMGVVSPDRRAAPGETIPSSPKELDETFVQQVVDAAQAGDDRRLSAMGKDALIRFAAAHGRIMGERKGQAITMKTARNRFNIPQLIDMAKEIAMTDQEDGLERPETVDTGAEIAEGGGKPTGTNASAVLPTNGMDAIRK